MFIDASEHKERRQLKEHRAGFSLHTQIGMEAKQTAKWKAFHPNEPKVESKT